MVSTPTTVTVNTLTTAVVTTPSWKDLTNGISVLVQKKTKSRLMPSPLLACCIEGLGTRLD